MIVVDTSAVVEALVSDPRNDTVWRRIANAADLHAPHVIDLEVAQALRRLVAGHVVSPDRASDSLVDFTGLRIIRYPHLPFMERIWQLRGNLTAYDAAFIALSEALHAPLVTCDARLATAPGHYAIVETYPA